MTSQAAAQLLELPADATPDQLEARFHELRAKLEDKIAKAPTPGLKAKYRESLDEITVAFETLTLASDSSSLPVLKREQGEGRGEKGNLPQPETTRSDPAPSSLRPSPPARRKSGTEFALVAVIAVAVLAAGGWFILKTRAENAEKARIAAEMKAEADRQAAAEKAETARRAEEARLAAEAARRLAEEERARQAAVEKAEQDRLDRLAAQVRVQLAEMKLIWEGYEREERDAERSVADLRSAVNSWRGTGEEKREPEARLAAHQTYYGWLRDFFLNHPARRMRVRAEELLAARQVDEAAAEVPGLQEALAGIRPVIAEKKKHIEDTVYCAMALNFANKVDRWELHDAYGKTFFGDGGEPGKPASLPVVACGPATVSLVRNGNYQKFPVVLSADGGNRFALKYPDATVIIESNVTEAEVYVGGLLIGKTPHTISHAWPGIGPWEVRAPGHKPATVSGRVEPGQTLSLTAILKPDLPSEEQIIRDFTVKAAGVWKAKMPNSPATSLMRISAGSPMIEGKGRAMMVMASATSILTVTNRATAEMVLTPADPKLLKRVREMDSFSTIRWEGDMIVTANKYIPRLVYQRVAESEW